MPLYAYIALAENGAYRDFFSCRIRALRGLPIILSLLLLSAIHSNPSFADNSSDISEIKKLYSEINRDVKEGRYKKLYIFTKFPSEQHLIQETYTDDVRYSPDTVVVHYRKGYVAKIEHKATDGDIEVVNEYYFRQNGLLFFHYSEHDELTGPRREVPVLHEERNYVNLKGRLIRTMHSAYYTKKGKKNGLVYSENQMDIDMDAKDKVDLYNVKDFEFYKSIEKYINK